jgi:hypothetical protein
VKKNDTQVSEYVISMLGVAAWIGTLKQLRLDIGNANTSGTVKIDQIDIELKPEEFGLNNGTIHLMQDLTRWFRVRQKAIDDAKRNVPHKNLEMYYYLEVNLSDLALKGESCLINSILPNINPDYVSFSSYTATNPPKNKAEIDKTLTEHLNYIESKMKPKPEIKD